MSYVNSSRKKAARIIGSSMCHEVNGNNEQNLDPVGDLYLFSKLKSYAHSSLNEPLVELSSMDIGMRYTEASILPFGIDVKEERENTVVINGLNDWVGGVHLDSSSGGMWFRKDEKLIYKSLN
ncbi:MAG: hypothetical protein O7D86_10900 [Proteobacteria bacterium]|nr:hypothetical protein [Pseudomonadota bacterium]